MKEQAQLLAMSNLFYSNKLDIAIYARGATLDYAGFLIPFKRSEEQYHMSLIQHLVMAPNTFCGTRNSAMLWEDFYVTMCICVCSFIN